MAGKAAVPKFGSWDAENIGYTVFFEKVRENKTAPVPATTAPPAPPKGHGHDDYEFDPYEHYENLSRNAPSRPASSQGHGHAHAAPPAQYYENPGRNNAPPSRPASSHGYGHPAPPPQQQQHGYHRRNGSNGSSAASEVSSRASKFSPPRPYQPRYGNSNNNSGSYHQPQPQQQYAAPAPRHHQQQPQAPPAPRVAASPPRHAPPPANERRPGVQQARAAKAPSAVPRFGVWDEQNAAQGFTVQFEKVQRQREVAKVAAPDVQPPPRQQQQLSPDRAPPTWGRPLKKPKKSFLSKVYACLFPVVRQ